MDTLNKLGVDFTYFIYFIFTSVKYLRVYFPHWTSDPLKLTYPLLVNQIQK